jgi:hypothetical protein
MLPFGKLNIQYVIKQIVSIIKTQNLTPFFENIQRNEIRNH